MLEEWRVVPGYLGRYEVSNFGQVRSVGGRKPTVLKQVPSGHGHMVVKLYLHGFGSTRRVHTLVWSLFHTGLFTAVYHKDGNLLNNRLDNLTLEREVENV